MVINQDLIDSVYIHVDNGGPTFAIYKINDIGDDNYGYMIRITDSYYNNSKTSLELYQEITSKNLRKIGQMFLRAADKIENK